MEIKFVPLHKLRHIEGFSEKRVAWLTDKVLGQGRWTKPVALDSETFLVMDGQHRMEVAHRLGLDVVPAVLFRYNEVDLWSLRPNHSVTWESVVSRGVSGDIYPYKTVKHRFPKPIPACDYPLSDLGLTEGVR